MIFGIDFLYRRLRDENDGMGEAGGGSASDPGGQQAQQGANKPAQEAQEAEQGQRTDPAHKTPENGAEADTEQVSYAETGDPTLDYVLGYLADNKLAADHPAVEAAKNGSFDQLEVELAKRDAKGYDKVLNLARKSYEQHQAKQQEHYQQTESLIHDTVGGPEEWTSIQQWASENAEDDEKEAVNELLAKGGVSARIAADFLARSYRNANGTEYKGKEAASQDRPAARQQSSSNDPLTRREFADEAQKLYRKHGNDYQNTPAYKALARRLK